MKYSVSKDDCFLVNAIHGAVASIQENHQSLDPLEQALLCDDLVSYDDEELVDMVALLDAQSNVTKERVQVEPFPLKNR